MTDRYVALLRGINVGTAKALAMSELTSVYESLGLTDVRTLLRSGNVVFDSDGPVDAATLSRATEAATGVSSDVVLLTADRFRAVAAANPLADVIDDPSRAIVCFLDGPLDAAAVAAPSAESLAPERLALGDSAIYQWCPDGISKSKVPPRFFTSLGAVATGRNVRTVEKLLAMLDD
ncbi:uncharacterized protein (DUF1697 family) [Conyzicola lurida]|uniref:Uncharacterized protein (DUF1697 family) n=1 Tax=Conyzicola lurida TaxID=1172621 RepID=A0A841APH6_9MICO|nr:DUF1697 domain-containing protein [Conyzicola lurida]MBB5843661.1 uncharacterized protein (DUF1697 family) [Conyzicola lurida]